MHLDPTELEGFRGAFVTLLSPTSDVDGSVRTQERLLRLLAKVLSRDGAPMPPATIAAIADTVPGALAAFTFADGARVVLDDTQFFRRTLIAKRELRRRAEAAHQLASEGFK